MFLTTSSVAVSIHSYLFRHQTMIIKRTIHRLPQLNLFRDPKTINQANAQVIRDQVLTTRAFLVLMIISVVALITFASSAPKTISLKILTPSQAEYERLQATDPDNFVCPCENIAVSSGTFLSIVPIFHQVQYLFFAHIGSVLAFVQNI